MKSMFRILGLIAIVVCAGQATVTALPSCVGQCRVQCIGGPTYVYSTPSYSCCGRESICPNGGITQWSPGSSWQCAGEFGLICQ